ncbi:Rap1a/Tai family immunity protein [Polynucleobacter arcticus]|nr:Rap1a/Tai family immunity protein [Polynucleobacter arcticus]
MKKLSIVVASLLMSAGVVVAATGSPMAISTSELVGVCSDQSSPAPQTYCDIYGQGVFDSYLVTRYPQRAPDFVCVTQPAPSRREVMGQFVDWVKANPVYNTAPAADTLLRFLAVRFPCNASSMSPANAVNKIVR